MRACVIIKSASKPSSCPLQQRQRRLAPAAAAVEATTARNAALAAARLGRRRQNELLPPLRSTVKAAAAQASRDNHNHNDTSAIVATTQTPLKQLPPWLPRAAALVAAGALLSCAAPAVAHAAAKAAAAADGGGSSVIQTLISFALHLDKHLAGLIAAHGRATYALLWAIVFCETGLVLTPFLPGDSLLFAAGAFAGMGSLDLGALFAVFMSSAILGDAVNYAVGARLGKWALNKQLLNPAHVQQTSKFYAKYGGKTVVLARFVPIVRTFAPFVAGVGAMEYPKFALYNVVGALVWTVLFLGAGYFFGNLPVVQHNFTLVVLGIIAISVVPVVLEVLAARREAAQGGGGNEGGGGGGAPKAA